MLHEVASGETERVEAYEIVKWMVDICESSHSMKHAEQRVRAARPDMVRYLDMLGAYRRIEDPSHDCVAGMISDAV